MTPPGMVAVAVAVLAAALYWVPLSLSASLAHVLLAYCLLAVLASVWEPASRNASLRSNAMPGAPSVSNDTSGVTGTPQKLQGSSVRRLLTPPRANKTLPARTPMKHAEEWRARVRSLPVERAWDSLCGALIQEWVYDAWWAQLTDDKELPVDTRRLLNRAFGEVAHRARGVDKTALLARDCVGFLAQQVRTWHVATASIGLVDPSHTTWAGRDRALRREMLAEHVLHPALATEGGLQEYCRKLAAGLVSVLVPESNDLRILHVLTREILANTVLLPITGWFQPYYLNSLVTYLLVEASAGEDYNPGDAVDGAEPDKTHISNRAYASVQAEHRHAASAEAAEALRRTERDLSAGSPAPAAPAAAVAVETPRRDDLATQAGAETPATDGQVVGGAEDSTPGPSARPSSPPGSSLHSRAGSRSSYPDLTTARQRYGTILAASVRSAEVVMDGEAEVVVYTIHASNGQEEWTVMRRFRNFEALHRAMRDNPHYRYRLPPKRFLVHTKTAEFIESRKAKLDQYIGALCRDSHISKSFGPLWDFLTPTGRYLPDVGVDGDAPKVVPGGPSQQPVPKPTMFQRLVSVPNPTLNRLATAHRHTASRDRQEETREWIQDRAGTPGPMVVPPPQANTPVRDAPELRRRADTTGPVDVPGPSEVARAHTVDVDATLGRRPSLGLSQSAGDLRTVQALDDGVRGSGLAKGHKPRMASDAPMAPPAASVQEAEAAPLSAEALRLMDPFDGLVTEIFRLDSRGWWRRRIVFMVRQVLSAMAGDAMDKFIVAQIEAMQREHLIARAIKHLEESLWPKGVWFQRDATSRQAAASNPMSPGSSRGRASSPAPPGVEPAELVRVQRELKKALESKCPKALYAVLGEEIVTDGLQDLFAMLQSETLGLQIGLSLLEIVVGALFPELRGLLGEIGLLGGSGRSAAVHAKRPQ